jgi:hypothetical protein
MWYIDLAGASRLGNGYRVYGVEFPLLPRTFPVLGLLDIPLSNRLSVLCRMRPLPFQSLAVAGELWWC